MRFLHTFLTFLLLFVTGIVAQCPQYDLSHIQESYELNCDNDFSITLQAILDGEPPASIEWRRTGTIFSTENEVTITNVATPYVLEVTGQDGCVETTSFGVTNGALGFLPSTILPIYCAGPTDPIPYCLTYMPSGATAEWSNGATGTCSENIVAGDTITVFFSTFSGGCKDTMEYVAPFAEYEIYVFVDGDDCGGQQVAIIQVFDNTIANNGQLEVYVENVNTSESFDTMVAIESSGGFEWSLPPGTYGGFAFNQSGCGASLNNFTINPPGVVIATATVDSVNCPGDADGSISVTFDDGQSPFTYLWDNGQTTATITNLTAGSYTLTVTDANGCTDQASYTVSQPDSLEIELVESGPASCAGEPVGYLQIEVTGGTGAYGYAWSNGGDTTLIDGLAVGSYFVTVTDANGCTAEASYELEDGIDAIISWSGEGTLNCLEDAVTLAASPDGPDFTYLWAGPGVDGQTDASVIATELGRYFVTVTNGSQLNCTGVDSFDVVDGTEPFDFTLVGSVADCVVGDSYMIEGFVGAGGGYDYLIELDGIFVESGQINDPFFVLLVQDPGLYEITLVNLFTGCVETRFCEVLPFTPFSVEFAVDTAVCSTGSADIMPNIISGTEPFTWLWSNGAQSPSLFNVASGTYSVTVTDGNGCMHVEEVFGGISEPLTVEFNNTNPFCGETDGSIAVTNLTSGIPPFIYNWSNGSDSSTLTNVGSGTYDLTITDAVGCENTWQLVLLNDFQANIIEEQITGQGCAGALPQLTAMPNTANFTYFWTGPNGFTSTEASFQAPEAGIYTVTISAVDGSCSDFVAIEVSEAEDFALTEITVTPAPCFDFTTLVPQYTFDPVDEFVHRWIMNGDTIIHPGPAFQAEAPGSYVYIGTNTFTGCVVTDSLFLATVGGPCEGVVGRLWAVQSDCSLNGTEIPVANTPIRIEEIDGTSVHYTVTDGEGVYQADLPPGTYEAFPLPFATDIFEDCDNMQLIQVDEDGNALDDLFIIFEEACPSMYVNLAVPNLIRCFSNDAFLYYCNDGPSLAEDATITVELDPFLFFQGASIPPASVANHLVTFELGDLPPFTCGTIELNLLVSCEAEIGQTHCVEATATPNEPCPAPDDWNGANLVLGADCLADSLEFRITNNGTATTTQGLSYLVIEDGIMMLNGPTDGPFLNPAEEFRFRLPANGSTYRLETNQEANNPGFGMPTLVVEGCGTDQAGNFSTGFVNQLPLNDTDVSWYDILCRQNVGAYDPNEKMGLPLGVGEPKLIKPGTPIVYDIQFQNTGTDTARTVVLRDTIAPEFDLNTLRVGAASHNYIYTLDSNRALTITFADIMLPDSFTNVAASQGVISYYIEHYADLPLGTELRNQAAIYFDFNEPIFTSNTLHTLGEDFLSTLTSDFSSGHKLTVFPNPADRLSQLTFECSTPGAYLLEIFDGLGRKVMTHRSNGDLTTLDMSQEPVGWYLARATSLDGSIIGLRKFVLK
ncbi:hypothetical protein CEQ90_10175 [Lewinellaceae bacterium SD302]|nr:hypothetical protein CEQ90_10175 [Lewinellaceae bacterium SD302]